jgi:hypothetical protein
MNAAEAINHLARASRAYNALYSAYELTPETVPTLTPQEVDDILSAAADVERGVGDTEMHQKLRTINPTMLRYVVGGGL